MQNSKIEWCDHTINLWIGCERVKNHPGCQNCYAATFANRFFKENKLWDGNRQKVKAAFSEIMRLQANAHKKGVIERVFVSSLSDVFERSQLLINKNGEQLPETTGDIRKFFFETIIPACPNLVFLLLTKRPSNINKMIPAEWVKNPPMNVMFGTSASDEKTFNDYVGQLAKVKGFKFVSLEPQISYFKPDYDLLGKIHWLIQGGESGHGHRPFVASWARAVRDRCEVAQVPYFLKQFNKEKGEAIPPELLVRQFPILDASLLTR
jgi:protein gp37